MTTPPDDATQPDGATPPDATQRDATQRDATQPGATQPDATQPDATQPGATQPGATQPDATDPAPPPPSAPGQAWAPQAASQPEVPVQRTGIRPAFAAHPVVVGAVVAVLAAGGAFAGGYAVGHGTSSSGERARFEFEGELPFPDGDLREFRDGLPERPENRTRPDSGRPEEFDPSDGSPGSPDT